MKKSKLSIGLVTSFIGALALTSCGSDAPAVTPSNNSVIDFIGYNTQSGRLEINVGELYREFGESKDGTTKYYNAILESLIRYEYPLLAADVDPKEPDLKKYSRILSEANDEVTKRKGVAQKNAENNDTDFDEEWQKILDSNDVDSEEDLRLKFVYEKEQDAIKDWYFKKHYESTSSAVGLRQEYLGVDKDWEQVVPTTNVDPVYPYHVIHILVKLSADASDYTRASISEAEAKKLWEIVKQLVDGQYTFEETAKLSDDTSSSEYGDVELMSTRTSFYNEFKLGTWAYDAILSEVNSETAEVENIYKAYGLDSSATIVTKTMNDAGHIDETEENVQDLIHETMLDEVNVHMEAAQITSCNSI
jgi:parvulin-like peptidyl-prolyl isomerase